MIFNFALIIFLYFLIIVSGKLLYDKGVSNLQVRNISKFFAYIITIYMHKVLNFDLAILICIFFTIILLISKKYKALPSIFEYKEEKNIAPILLPLGIILLALTFWNFKPYIFEISCLVMAFSDVISKTLGQKIGNIKLGDTGKTLEGSIIFLINTVILYLFMFGVYKIGISYLYLVKILTSSLILTFVQSAFNSDWDNLPLPFLTGLVSVWVFYG